MSRVARIPVPLVKGVEATLGAGEITVKGPLGTLKQFTTPNVKIEIANGEVSFAAADETREANAMSGTLRALVAGMVQGVSKGFERKLNLVGVGYRAQAQGDKLNLSVGFSHPVVHQMPAGITCTTPTQTEILIKGVDKQRVGQVAAEVRGYRPPEPYKGKGVRYADEVVIIKESGPEPEMIDKKESRLRRARATRARIALQKVNRLTVFRTNLHIYASVISPDGGKVLASASTVEPEVRNQLATKGKGGNAAAAKLIGERIAQKARAAGVEAVAFDRSGFLYHGRVKALAEAAREAGLKF